MKWFREAVTGPDNKTYEGAYLALAYIMGLAGISIVCLLALAFVDLFVNDAEFNPAGLGGGISAVLGGLAAFLGGVGAYILMDRKQQFPPSSTTTTEQSTVVKTVAAPPIVAPAVPAVSTSFAVGGAADGTVEPLRPKIGPEDVGKSVAIVKPQRRKRGRKA